MLAHDTAKPVRRRTVAPHRGRRPSGVHRPVRAAPVSGVEPRLPADRFLDGGGRPARPGVPPGLAAQGRHPADPGQCVAVAVHGHGQRLPVRTAPGGAAPADRDVEPLLALAGVVKSADVATVTLSAPGKPIVTATVRGGTFAMVGTGLQAVTGRTSIRKGRSPCCPRPTPYRPRWPCTDGRAGEGGGSVLGRTRHTPVADQRRWPLWSSSK